jgi:hypothetical protein
MRVAWAQKWLTIPYNGSTVMLQGKSQVVPTCTIIELLSLDSSAVSVPHYNWHPRIQSILHQYASVLEDPTGLPPKRECEHSIPLVLGAQPFLVKHYRYPPNLKDEIEQQVTDMLQLPATGAIHTIFHVSPLKRAVGCDSALIPQLPQLSDPLQVPVTIMQTRLLEHGGEFLTQLKVTWSSMVKELANWEDADALREQFPATPAWGQAGSEGRGNVNIPHPSEHKDDERRKELM